MRAPSLVSLAVLLCAAGTVLRLGEAVSSTGGLDPPLFVRVKASSTGVSDPGLVLSHPNEFFLNASTFLGVSDNAVPFFSVIASLRADGGGCGGYETVSDMADAAGCLYAVNGGPFVMDLSGPNAASCLGYVVSNGTVLASAPGANESASFGLDSDGYWVLGQLQPDQLGQFRELLTGFNWLVRDGAAVPCDPPGSQWCTEVAPRTAVGVDSEGRLMILEVDGVELITPPAGLTIDELANGLVALGAVHAVNFDGGGSSTTYYNGSVIDFPTCVDVPILCERPVVSGLCLAPGATPVRRS